MSKEVVLQIKFDDGVTEDGKKAITDEIIELISDEFPDDVKSIHIIMGADID
jgi:hypothetical protein